MTRSSRILNRLILFVVGVAALAAGALFVVPGLADRVTWPDPAAADTLWIVAGACAAIAVLSVAWIASRGRGRTGSALRIDGVDIDIAVVGDVLGEAFRSSPDVVGVTATAHVRRGARLIRVAIRTRPHPDLPTLRDDVDAAVQRLDAALGIPLPLVVHLTTGLRSAFAGTRTAH